MGLFDIYKLLTNKLGEAQLAQHILMFAAPVMEEDVKRDIVTFYFTWNAVTNYYVDSNMKYFFEMGGSENIARWFVYHNLLREIDKLIMNHDIQRNRNRTFLDEGEKFRRTYSYERFRVYWQNYILSSWNPSESFLVLTRSLNQQELLDLSKKFLLRFSPMVRLLLLRKLGILPAILEAENVY